jgi:hypothetical protein
MVSTVSLISEDGARFRQGAGEREAGDELDTLLDQRDSGSLSQKRYLLALSALLERTPTFICPTVMHISGSRCWSRARPSTPWKLASVD